MCSSAPEVQDHVLDWAKRLALTNGGRCGVYGHDGKDCSLPCRRCGDPHATVACTIKQSYSEAASKNFPPLQPETPAEIEREGLSTPAPVTCQDQAVQLATLRETPTVSPASPDPAIPEGNEDRRSTPRPTVIPTEPQVEPPLNKAPLGEHVAEVDEMSEAHDMAAQSAESSPVIEETPSRDDDVSVDEDSNSATSETPLRIDEDTTPSDVSRDSLDVFVQSSRKSPSTKRHRISSSDSEAPSRDRSPLRASTRPRKPRASGGSPGRKK
ncbi:hypothetical protein HPB52_004888 [Rhipicephalus sanguineus]|uniref:Uncharacterized protein n=1 Tax=Rhipicephalus sanguineus TaxID=34632 RepID=A0A9D4PJZ9_RHISA|nr:hypothetical protein HPB52_004888 [Rhipicephalus sanguineus]